MFFIEGRDYDSFNVTKQSKEEYINDIDLEFVQFDYICDEKPIRCEVDKKDPHYLEILNDIYPNGIPYMWSKILNEHRKVVIAGTDFYPPDKAPNEFEATIKFAQKYFIEFYCFETQEEFKAFIDDIETDKEKLIKYKKLVEEAKSLFPEIWE